MVMDWSFRGELDEGVLVSTSRTKERFRRDA